MMHCSAAPCLAGLALAIGLAGCAVSRPVPADGLYNGELCTAAVTGPLNCGAADAWLSNGRAKLRVSDFIYDLAMEDGQVEVMLVHDRTLVDVWSASYSWDHHYLRFIDQRRRTFYRVRFANPPARLEGGHPAH
ncbi:MAG: hypothetical protein ABIN37_17815 [Burkholderiaceae bacterium]